MTEDIGGCLQELFAIEGKPQSAAAAFRILNHAILDTQLNGGEILYFSGKYIGQELMNACKKRKSNNLPAIMKTAVERLDMGDVVGMDLKNNTVSLEIENCPFRKKGVKRGCNLLQGMLAGILSGATGRTYALKSVSPNGRGRRYCIFRFRRMKR